eukprot:c20335_g1_i7.p1 GENE.c20335_g1_i7~~c20335_g1_i7.p1  ORF type:complete len:277 (+),score=38.44 c20335_g1_i7:612-1442(+)
MHAFLIQHGFSDFRILTDDSANQPTRDAILSSMRWLVADARPGDSLFFHYSGHGAQETDHSGFEPDGLNETIIPVDFKRAGMITDDLIWETLVFPLPSGCRLTAVMDCCHAGTGMDLPFAWDSRQGRWVEDINPCHSCGDVQLFSGCADSQTSVDTYDSYAAGGAMTSAFIAAVRENPYPTYPQLMAAIYRNIKSRGHRQDPQLSSSQRFDFNQRVFDLCDGFIPNQNSQIGRIQRQRFQPVQPNYNNDPFLASFLGIAAGILVADIAVDVLSGLF